MCSAVKIKEMDTAPDAGRLSVQCVVVVRLLQEVAIAVCGAIDRTGVKYEVLEFNNRSDLKLSSEI